MTEYEMRVRLVEAMGYHRCKKYRGSPSAPWMGPDGAYASTIPNPWESDRDAALLRAWCVGRGWIVELCSDRHRAVGTVRYDDQVRIGQGMAETPDEPDPLRRERLALCRAVLQALEAIEAGGVP